MSTASAMAIGSDLARLLTPRRVLRLGGVALAQVGVQLIGFVAALVLVRTMEPAHYGWFTLASSMIVMATVLGDLGLASAVVAVGGRFGATREATQAALQQARRLQVPLALLGLGVTAVVTAGLLQRQGVPAAQLAALCVLVAGCAWWQMRAALDLGAARLLGHVVATQRLELAVNGLRLALVTLAAAAALLDAMTACAAALVAAAAWHLLLRRHLRRQLVDAEAVEAPAPVRAAVLEQLRMQAPNSLYYLVSTQVALWLLGLFGDAQRVAELGALTRLAAVFAIVGSVVAALVLPHFARHRDAAAFVGGLRAVNLFFALVLAALLLAGWAWPGPLLWVLGGHYRGLADELPWMLLATTLSAWGGVLYSVGCARGWVLPVWIAAPLGAAAIVAAAAFVEVGTVRGSLIVNTAAAAAALLANFAFLGRRVRQLRAQPQVAALAGGAP